MFERSREHLFDAAIIGAGPAGVSCAVWLARLGFAPLLLEADKEVGGLCRRNPFRDEWNVTLPGMTGAQVADNLGVSLKQANVPQRLSYRVRYAGPGIDGFELSELESGHEALRARHIVLATGVTARRLPQADEKPCGAPQGDGNPSFPRPSVDLDQAPLFNRTAGRATPGGLLIGPGEHIVAYNFKNRRVAVLGGGDNAFENALYAREHGAASVHLYARGVRAQRQFVHKLPATDVSVGVYRVDPVARTVNGCAYDVIMVFYGWEPCVRFADTFHLRRTKRGFIATDPGTAETSYPGVYAIGEVAQRQHPCVVSALADGVAAAKAIQARIENF